MGAVAAEASDFWARIQTAENQKLPDSKARVRFLLDEIALLQTRLDSNKHAQDHEAENFQPFSDVPNHDLVEHDHEAHVEHEPSVNELRLDEATTTSMGSVHITRCEDFLQFIEEKLRILVEERVGFFETAEKELRIGKVERLELAKLLRLEKTKLQRHRQELEEYRAKWTSWQDEYTKASFLWNAVQEIIGKFLKLLDDRESLQVKFEVQVELGHFFRLLKLLEVQKAKDEHSKREIERKIEELKALLDKARMEVNDTRTNDTFEQGEESVEPTNEREDELAVEVSDEIMLSESEAGTLEVMVDGDSVTTVPVHGDGSADSDYRRSKREAKAEILKLMAEQEQKWKDQQEVLQEIDRRLSLSEVESHRVTAALKEGRRCECNEEPEVTSVSGDLPRGYTSIYFSPIFQERRQTSKAHQDDKDLQIHKLKKEISHLKENLLSRDKQQVFCNGFQIPLEEKTISVDASSSSGFYELLDSACSGRTADYCHLSDEDKRFCQKAAQEMSRIISQHRHELAEISSSKAEAELRERLVEAFRSMSEQCRRLCEEAEVHFNKEVSCKSEAAAEVKADMARAADEHARELDRKEKTLAYAQELNLRLANDMSKAENALSELRIEHTGLRLALESKLKAAENEAEALTKRLRNEISNLDEQLKEKERQVQDVRSRAEACRRETDAAVLEKNSCLQRLQDEVEEREVRLRSLENELTRSKQDGAEEACSSQLQEARQELKKAIEAHLALERRYQQLQARLLETEYELAQREAALERLTLHLAAAVVQQHGTPSVDEMSRESLRSRHRRKEQARKSIQEAEDQMAVIAAEMSKAKSEMEEMKSQSFQLLHRLRMR